MAADVVVTSSEGAPEAPKSLLDKLGATLPVALTMIATTFAGMSTGELQKAMFWRSSASQDQAKATSQWSLAGFKRDRSLICESTAAQLRAVSGYKAFPLEAGSEAKPEEAEALKWLQGQGPPRLSFPEPPTEAIKELLAAIAARKPEAELLKIAAKVTQASMNDAIDKAEEWNDATDKAWDPTIKAAAKWIDDRTKKVAGTDAAQASAGHAVRYDLEQRRYRAESFFNQQIGFLYEARVKVSTAESDKHRRKSDNFFYAMLAAQVGATIASLAMARKQKSILWLVAGLAGLVAITVGVAVFLM